MSVRETRSSSRIERRYTAIVCGDGRILPITESIGRRLLRQIEPEGREGRELLNAGKVTLWTPDGRRFQNYPVDRLLRAMREDLKSRAARNPRDRRWGAHLREVARSISRSRDRISH
jgi:hypothetical protein